MSTQPDLAPPRRLPAVLGGAHVTAERIRGEARGGRRSLTSRCDDEVANSIRVVVVDDDPVMRVLVRYTLERACLGIVVVGEADDGLQGLRRWRQLRPDVIVLDQNMPGLSGLQLAIRILAEEPDQRMLLFSALPEAVDDAARSVGVALIGKDESARLPHRIRELYEG